MVAAQRVWVIGGLGLLTLAGWVWIVPMALDMYGPMTGWSAWMMSPSWGVGRLILLWLMWAVMMAAMMLPSAIPLLLLYDTVQRKRLGVAHRTLAVYMMAAGYLFAWALFSVGATVLQRVLSRLLILNPMMEMPDRTIVGITLLVAGGYQLTPWKSACLATCRSPLAFVMQRWRRGHAGAFRMGTEHGAYCVGCCWALMLLLFAGGVMNLTVIVALTTVVLIEKLLPMGVLAARLLAVLLLTAGLWCVVGG